MKNIKSQQITKPESIFEKQIFDIVSNELNTIDFGVTTNLISMGLTSLKAIRISALLKEKYDYSISTGDILAKPYIRELVKFIGDKPEIIDIKPKRETYPLTSNQLGLYLDWEQNKDSLQYNLPAVVKLDNIDPQKLLKSLQNVIDAHPYLKAHLREDENAKIVQERRDDAKLDIIFKKLETNPSKEFFKELVKPFNLLNDDLARFAIYYTNDTTYLFFDIHHIISDGISMNILFTELIKSYQGQSLNPELANAYDYSLFYENWLNSDEYNKSEEYFKELIKDTEPFMYPSTSTSSTGKFDCYSVNLDIEKIRNYCYETGITENVFFGVVLCQVFHRICRKDTIQISTVTSGRSLYQLLNTMGMFIRTLPLVSRDYKGSVIDILTSMQKQIASTINNDNYPYTKLVENFGIKPNVLYIYQRDSISSKFDITRLTPNTVKVQMAVNVRCLDDKYNLTLDYDKDLYSREEIKNICTSIINLANNIALKPKDEKMETIPLVSDKEAHNLIEIGTGEKINYDETKTFVDLFLEKVKLNPSKTAVVDYKSKLSYKELDEQSNIIANKLLNLNIKPNDFVVVMLPRIKEFITSVIGIWKAGGTYLPIDTQYPKDRINYMIEDSNSKIIINEKFLSEIDFNKQAKPINLTTPNNLAYMIYTSGSTGKPKGVMIKQKNLLPFYECFSRVINVTKEDNFAHYVSFSFDASLDDYIIPILSGSTIHILNEAIKTNLEELYNYIVKNNIKHMTLPTQVGTEFSNRYKNAPLKSLLIGGEKVANIEKTSFKLINGYGPTEFTVCSSYHIVDIEKDFENIPIGRPVTNSISAIVDGANNLLLKGMIGELVLVGPQIAEGYWNRQELTNERFIECPFVKGQKMYKTGDMVRWNDNNELIYIGRKDNQVKLRGFRIELGEIDFVLSKVKGIKSCIADVKEINETKHLVGYYVADKEIDEETLKLELSKVLTYYMVPDIFVCLDKMPLTSNGKIDRKALPIPELKSKEIVLPEGDFEKQIFDIVSKELKTTDFGITTNLISMGLTSIKAINISTTIKQKLNYSISTGDILAKPYINEWNSLTKRRTEKIKKYPMQKTYPLTSNQLGIYVDWSKNKESIQYNLPILVKLNDVSPQKLLNALKSTIANHPYFKVHLKENENHNIVQERRDNEDISITFTKLEQTPNEEFFKQRIKPFDLLKDDLSRFEIYYTDNETFLFLDIHHIIFDGISFNILLSEIEHFYSNKEVEKEKASAYDYSLFYDNWLKTGGFAKSEKYFDELIKDTESFMYPTIRTKESGECKLFLGKVSKKNIQNFCFNLGITENAFFLTVLSQVFHRIGRNDNIQFATVSNGRSLEELSNTMGMFVQTVPFVSKYKNLSISKIFKSSQEQIISTIKNEKYPFTKLVEKYGVKPNVLYVYQGDVITSKYEAKELNQDNTKAPLVISISPNNDVYDLAFEYDNALYLEEDIENLCSCVTNFANNVILSSIDDKIELVKLVSESEAKDLIELGTGDKIDYDNKKTFVDLFLNQAKLNPEKIAVIDSKSQITYKDLDLQSNIIAHELINRGIKQNDFVVINLPRVKEFMCCVIGVWKAGCAYLPIDREYPIERINYMIEDSQAKIIIDEEFLSKIDFSKDTSSINHATADSFSYMIYTSGSTGKPKGVVINQSNLLAFIVWYTNAVNLKPQNNISEHASFSFDGSCIDLYPILTVGGTLHILSQELRHDMRGMIEYFKTNHIRGCFLTTQLARTLLSYDDIGLEYLMLGGEKDYGFKPSKTVVYEGYGPTETTIYATCGIIDQTFPDINNIPIGRPLSNGKCAIVDAKNNLLPRGMVGELVIMGPQVSKGYWHRKEITKEKFIECPFIQGERMYKSGDLAYWNKNGEVIIIGRIDNQIKLRGFRIELDEINSVLSSVEGIKACAADIKEINGIKHLVGYYSSDKEIEPQVLKDKLAKKLADYMVPDVFVYLKEMPLTSNGKIDKKALPLPTIESNANSYVKPVTKTEIIICDVYSDILNIENFSVTSNFFQSGGTSLTGIRVVAELQKNKLDIVYGDIFKYKTPRELANFLEHSKDNKDNDSKEFNFGDYDYTNINNMLLNARLEIPSISETKPLGDILLTGATGFLGIHVLKYLLDNTKDKIYLLIRSKDRLMKYFEYYFDYSLMDKHKAQIDFIEGDITEENLQEKLANINFDTLFNCAAIVKHYITDDQLDKVNVDGVRNLINCCEEKNARMIHISTYSVAGIIDKDSNKVLDEQHFYLGQNSDNDYVRTKFLAERYLLEAISQGKLKGKIMRLGNLMGRESDGRFQINFESNAFVNLLKSYSALGVYPTDKMDEITEMSPIDETAEAVVRLASTPDEMVIFHPFNAYHFKVKEILNAMNKTKLSIKYVSEADFESIVNMIKNDSSKVKYLQGIMHYVEHIDSNQKYMDANNEWTTSVLDKLGFEWKKPNEEYFVKFLNFLEEHQAFDM